MTTQEEDKSTAKNMEIPRVSIGTWPTPVQAAEVFGAQQGLRSLWIKREDLSHPICGGNKVRGLEYLLGRAQQRGVKTLVSFSSAGSHHLSKTAWHARQLGMRTIALFVPQPNAAYVRANIAAALAAGAKYVPANYATILPKTIWHLLRERVVGNGPVMFIPPGGTSRRSMFGHALAATELAKQIDAGELPKPDYLYVALGSLGTACGLAAGLHFANLDTRVVGVIVSHRWYCTPRRLKNMTRSAYQFVATVCGNREMKLPAGINALRPPIIEDALGPGYANFTASAMRRAQVFEAAEGLALDGTYMAKTVDGMLNYIEREKLRDKHHLLWYTYCPAPPAAINIDSLPNALRRYFENPVQPLDISGQSRDHWEAVSAS